MRRLAALLAGLVLGLGAGGCVRLGPKPSNPPLPVKLPSAYEQAATGMVQGRVDPHWWKDFADPTLNSLVKKALAHNPSITIAAARVMEARALWERARALRLPQLSLSATGKKYQTAVNPYMPLLPRRYESYELALRASYEVDLWQRLASADRAAWEGLLATEAAKEVVIQGVVAQVASAYFRACSLEKRLSIARQRVENLRESLKWVQARYDRGLASALQLKQARRGMLTAQAAVVLLAQQLTLARQELNVLTGAYPSAKGPKCSFRWDLKDLKPVPSGLPADLLSRRPDLARAMAQVRAAQASVAQAIANRLPRITLTGAFGYSSMYLHHLIGPASELWSLAAGILAPLVDWGARAAAQKAAEARLKQAVASWAKAVLTALQEVEGALATRRYLLRRERLLAQALAEATAAYEVATDRYKRGLSPYLDVLETERARYELADELVQCRLGIVTNRIRLYRALGGGWRGFKEKGNAGAEG